MISKFFKFILLILLTSFFFSCDNKLDYNNDRINKLIILLKNDLDKFSSKYDKIVNFYKEGVTFSDTDVQKDIGYVNNIIDGKQSVEIAYIVLSGKTGKKIDKYLPLTSQQYKNLWVVYGSKYPIKNNIISEDNEILLILSKETGEVIYISPIH